jgi:hypothetical protein
LHSLGSALVLPNSKETAENEKKLALLCADAAARMRGGSNPDDPPDPREVTEAREPAQISPTV